jgi:hypothetical protein
MFEMHHAVAFRTGNLTLIVEHLMAAHSKSYSEDLRWVLVYMYHKRNLSINEIERLTGLKSRSIRRVLKLYEETGQVMRPAAKTGRPKKLDENDVDVSYAAACFLVALKECLFSVSQVLHISFS